MRERRPHGTTLFWNTAGPHRERVAVSTLPRVHHFVHTYCQAPDICQFSSWLIDWLIDWLMIAYIALFTAHLSRLTVLACGSTWVTSFITSFFFFSFFLNIHRSGVLTALAWLVPHETAAVSAQVLCTLYNHAPCHFMQSHIRKVYACLTVTCHLHFWQNDRDLLRATAEKKIFPPLRDVRDSALTVQFHRQRTTSKPVIPRTDSSWWHECNSGAPILVNNCVWYLSIFHHTTDAVAYR